MSNDKKEGNIYERILKLFTQVMKLVMEGKRSGEKLANALQTILEERQTSLELHLFGKQKTGGYETGFDIEKHLIETGLMERACSLEDPAVKGWLADPSTYPEEYKGKVIFLWKSTRASGDRRNVAYLVWRGVGVIVGWRWLGDGWDGTVPALLASS